MWKNGVEIDEKSCTVYLVEVMRCENLILGLVFYDKTVECGIDVLVYSMTVVVDGLCKNGEVRKGMELVEEDMKGKQKCDDLNEDSQFSENVFGNNNGMRVWVQHLRDSIGNMVANGLGYAKGGVLLDFESSSLHSLPEEQNSGTSVMFSDSSDVMPSSLGDNSYDCFFRRMGSVATPGESSSGEMVSGFVRQNHKWPQSHTRSRKRRIMGHQLFPHRATVAGIGSNTTRIEGYLADLLIMFAAKSFDSRLQLNVRELDFRERMSAKGEKIVGNSLVFIGHSGGAYRFMHWKFAKPVRELGNQIAKRFWIEGLYIGTHLSLKRDVQSQKRCEGVGDIGIGVGEFILISLDVLQGFSFFLQMGFTLILATFDGLDVGLLGDVIGEDDCDDDG
ncbi:hypothetical protein Tco_0625731 [Tanacetum coccineum]|uniref:Uncharacterized protein n=1 Tax=Tanacetum coccineum TaxID=301880 RepID=A0ABQ4WHM2_9ASTR